MNTALKLVTGIIRSVIGFIYGIVGKKLTDEAWEMWFSFIKFLLIGLSNTLILFVVYYAVIFFVGSEYYIAGQTAGYFLGVINSYIWNSRFVFREGKTGAGAFVKMCLCYLLTYFIQAGLLYLQVNILHMSEYIAPVIAVVITTVINYFLNKFFAFGVK